MWDFLTKKCGIFGIEGGTKLWDFQHRGGDFRPLTSGHTGVNSASCWRLSSAIELQIDPPLEPNPQKQSHQQFKQLILRPFSILFHMNLMKKFTF